MSQSRRVAALMSSAAVIVSLLVLMAGSATVSARRCQEECDAEKDAANAACDSLGQGDPHVLLNDCYHAAFQEYESCSMNATSCSQSYQCAVQVTCTFATSLLNAHMRAKICNN